MKAKEVERIILTRPAVEAGEKLGFLPGDLQDKVDPYLRPLYDALYDIMGLEAFQKALAKGAIEVAPLAYMRGRTLNDSFIILDEAQNTTQEQMKMVLTRFGFGSKMVVTGDVTQVDLPYGKRSGLDHAAIVLKDTEGIGIIHFAEKDVVRHGKIAFIAFGARYPRSTYGRLIQPFAQLSAQFTPGARIDTLRQCESLFLPETVDVETFAYGAVIAEVTENLTSEQEPEEEVYNLLLQAYRLLGERNKRIVTLSTLLKLLVCCGFTPELTA